MWLGVMRGMMRRKGRSDEGFGGDKIIIMINDELDVYLSLVCFIGICSLEEIKRDILMIICLELGLGSGVSIIH